MAPKQFNYRRPTLYARQQAAIFHDKRYGWIEASTKAGKTVGFMAWILEKTLLGRQHENRWWVAPVYPQAEIAYSRLKAGIPPQIYSANDTKLRLTFVNGAHLWFKSGEKPDNLYGEDVYDAVIDEASRLRQESYHAVRSTLTKTRGHLRAGGNVKGRSNWFYRQCRLAESGLEDHEYHKITAYDAAEAGVLDMREIEDAKRTLPEHVFRELYLAEPSDDGGNPFGLKAIADCVAPLADDDPAVWGIDLAKSHDWTVALALNAKGRTCRVERFQKPWQDTIRTIRDLVGPNTGALVDSTGVGDPVLEALQQGRDNFEGFKFSSTSKQQLMEGLAVAIQQQEISFPEGPVRQELEIYEYEFTRAGVKYSAPSGLHDDCVCALALANRKRSQPSMGDNILAYYEMLAKQKNETRR